MVGGCAGDDDDDDHAPVWVKCKRDCLHLSIRRFLLEANVAGFEFSTRFVEVVHHHCHVAEPTVGLCVAVVVAAQQRR